MEDACINLYFFIYRISYTAIDTGIAFLHHFIRPKMRIIIGPVFIVNYSVHHANTCQQLSCNVIFKSQPITNGIACQF